jgi:hypothetical protein
MARILLPLFLLFNLLTHAQTRISGRVSSTKGETLIGANIYLENTYDGTSAKTDGTFSFTTAQSGDQVLVVSSLGFEEQKITIHCNGEKLVLQIALKESFNQLKAVSITAGNIEASDEERSVMLKPLDIVTTAGATGDITGALQTLPGTATVGNDGRLFVRGGAANETALFFDGLKVNNAYGSSLSGIPTRTRFSPQLFTGTFFSTGGYSAEYGQALSSVLALNTIDMPLRTQTDIDVMTVGGGISHTQRWGNTAATASLDYLNLTPYQNLVPQNLQWEKAPQNLNAEVLLRHKFSKRSLLKVFYANQSAQLGVYQAMPGENTPTLVNLNNRFHYGNLNYEQAWGTRWLLNTGVAYSLNQDYTNMDTLDLKERESLFHLKSTLSYFPHPKLSLRTGVEHYAQRFAQTISVGSRAIDLPLSSSFAEANYHINDALALKAGIRGEYFQQQLHLMPRLAAALRLAEHHQLSAAYGTFLQQQSSDVLIQQPTLNAAKSEHYVLSYQFTNEGRTFRAEAFVKNYEQLLTNTNSFASNGLGKAQGFDLFYRDRKSVDNLDFWITYSFIDSKRQYANFSTQVQPGFAPTHNFSLVGKYWVKYLRSQIGMSFSLNDGYTYDNPNLPGEMESKTKPFNSLSLNWSYLPRENLIIHFAVNNVLGTKNVFGYRYSETPNAQNQFTGIAMEQAADRFFFIGIFYTLSSDKKANQLNNL